MLRMGIEPNLAHLVSYQLTVDKKGNFNEQVYGDHLSIYSAKLDKSGVRNFREGKLPPSSKYNTQQYQELCTYSGLYGMWNDNGIAASRSEGHSLTFRSNVSIEMSNKDPFKLIAKLSIRKRRTISVAIEEGLQRL
jgi:hypothetical protein